MRYYAMIDDENKCVGTQQSDRDVLSNKVVEITHAVNIGIPLDDFLFRKYEGGAWSETKFDPETPAPSPSADQRIAELEAQNAEILLALVMNDLI